MNIKHFYLKDSWNKGPWLDECDYVAWIDDATVYRCVARRNIYGVWSGFVGLDHSHPLYMVPLKNEEFQYIDVHGGISFANFSNEDDCMFVPPQRLWWIGFTCMNDTDIRPTIPDIVPPKKVRKDAVYRTLEYVQDQLGILIEQLIFFDTKV